MNSAIFFPSHLGGVSGGDEGGGGEKVLILNGKHTHLSFQTHPGKQRP